MPLERRRLSRHRIQTPAYASVLGNAGGVITDANESGIAIQGVTALPVASEVALRLDLLETRSIVEADACVVWSDQLGRSGLEFRELSEEARRQMQQWLLVNALSLWATTPEGGPPAEVASHDAQGPSEPVAAASLEDELAQAAANALSATVADGAAIALVTGAEAVCFASAGALAPPVGSHLDSNSGISGACLLTGRLMRCDDAESDPRVDRESCRALGISSVAAAPILIAGKVAGLVEVFSGHPNAFNEDSCSTLQALAASVAVSVQMHAALQVATSEPGTGLAKAPEAAAPLSETPPAAPSATGTEATVEPEPQDSAAPGPYERLTAAAAAAAVAAPAAESASVPAAIEEVAPASGQLHSNTAAVTEPELEPSPDPATLASEFGAAPVGEPEGGSDVRRRLALILPIVALFLLGIVFLLVRGGRPTKTSELAAPVLPDVSAKPSSMARTVPGASLSNIKAQAERGDANAEFELGAKYASGEDVKQSYPQAVKWFTKAADQGHVLAAATLGAFYWAGRGLPQDYVSAYMWSAIAKEGGDEASKYRVAILGSRMSAGEVNEAQRRATEWLQRHPKFVASKMSPAQPQ